MLKYLEKTVCHRIHYRNYEQKMLNVLWMLALPALEPTLFSGFEMQQQSIEQDNPKC